MDNKIISPYRVYKAEEAAHLLGVDKRSLYEDIDKKVLKAKMIGKGWKILGENLLSYMGSPSVNAMQPNRYSGGVPTFEEAKNTKTDWAEKMGAVSATQDKNCDPSRPDL